MYVSNKKCMAKKPIFDKARNRHHLKIFIAF